MNVTMQDLNQLGFIFKQFDKSLISFDDLELTVKNLKELIETNLSVKGENLYYDFDSISYKNEIKPHYHLIPGSFQVVVWLPKNQSFTGRLFQFGSPDFLQQVKPELGFMCFMKPNDPNFIHGVSPLTSHHSIKTLGFSSLIKRVEGNQDINVNPKAISSKVLNIHNLTN